MTTFTSRWRPRIGDRVSIKGTKLTGTVLRINGHGEDCRYVIPDAQPGQAVYWLGDIAPVGQPD